MSNIPPPQFQLSLQDAGLFSSIFVRLRYLKHNPLNRKGYWNLNTVNEENLNPDKGSPINTSRIICCTGKNVYYHIDFISRKITAKIPFELMPRYFRRYNYIMTRPKNLIDINTLWWGKNGLIGRNQHSVNISLIRIKFNKKWRNIIDEWIEVYEKTHVS